MELKHPIEISPRLDAGIRLFTPDGPAWVQVHALEFDGKHTRFKWIIDDGEGKQVGEGEDLTVYGPHNRFETVHDAITTLLVFLDLSAVEPSAPFLKEVQQFAKDNNDEIQFMLHELESQAEPKI